ncbi:hypothetical protein [Psychroserpens jangbogonensis]|uniref:hypothetical protein n=1 Tax=Psychroserpens jangbogonensis TaxID=1484460 RepID=UPI00053CF7F1|nr:hypothetical protein [Psychroserpens jangbogonensis]
MSLTKIEKNEMEKFHKTSDLKSCDIYKDSETLKIWHSLKDKGKIRFRGNQGNLQYFQLKE